MSVAAERIERLHELARAAASDSDDERAREYVRLARRVAERNRLRLPRTFRRFTCDRCDRYLRPGTNARVRLQDGHVVITCDCGSHARYPYDNGAGDTEDEGSADENESETADRSRS
ncbi:ribonuclease P [Halostagnicola larsenii XH-48]|uniref:Ribonuclease P protein component 4 n=1 Tax=Halostagnicola larsenii XH-48 TaxID=797299 RepID=W0JQ21_9EURY|nr:ribonuclease P protein component 4 [Halostagnicola larsenii]AHF99102.1 ribonuclease P [Halostagnicola larsenii XH-48]